jgi:hypothetical protein
LAYVLKRADVITSVCPTEKRRCWDTLTANGCRIVLIPAAMIWSLCGNVSHVRKPFVAMQYNWTLERSGRSSAVRVVSSADMGRKCLSVSCLWTQ